MVVLASVTAAVIGRAALGDAPFLHLPPFHVEHLSQYALFALLGVIAGVVGVVFHKVLYRTEDLCDMAWRGPEWARPAVGGLLLLLPQMYGVGYPVLEESLTGGYALIFLGALLIGKILATSLTIGIGGSGFGLTAHHVLPGIAGPVGAYGLIGMGAVFAGAARAPITAVIIMFELTGEYSIILPLMAAIVLAAGVSRLLTGETVYTAKLLRRGVDIDAPMPGTSAAALRVGEVMEPTPAPLPEGVTLGDAADALAARRTACDRWKPPTAVTAER